MINIRSKQINSSDLYALISLGLACIGLFGIVLSCFTPAVKSFSAPQPPVIGYGPPSSQPQNDKIPSDPTTTPRTSRNNTSLVQASSASNDTSVHLFRFINDSARLEFMSLNKLQESNLIYVPMLKLYVANLSQLPIPTDGTVILENHTYSALLTPTDPSYSSQWYLPTVHAPAAWDDQTGDSNIITAVLDTGVAKAHEDLISKWSQNLNETGSTISEGPTPNCSSRGLSLNKNCNNIDDDNDGYIDNYLGWSFVYDTNNVETGQTGNGSSAAHGTIVSGILGASANNGKGISGGNWDSKILPIQVLDDTGSGTTLSVSQGIRYAVDHGAQVINMSLGSNSDDQILSEQVQYAISHGVTIVAAAGNDGCNCILYPARYPGVISVGATTQSNVVASFSSFGSGLTLTAPGTNICSTSWSPNNALSGYGCGYSGTSFASPLVASQAALLLSQDHTLTPNQVKTALIQGATKLSAMNGLTRTDSYGAGLLNGAASLTLISPAAPQGIPLNVHTVSAQSVSPGPGYDAINSICIALAPALCRVEATNTSTNESIVVGTANESDLYNLYWSSQALHLSPGIWAIKIYAVTTTSKSLSTIDSLTVNP